MVWCGLPAAVWEGTGKWLPARRSREEQPWHFCLWQNPQTVTFWEGGCVTHLSTQQLPKSPFSDLSRHAAPSLKGHAQNTPNEHNCSFPRSIINVVTFHEGNRNLMFHSTLLRCPRQPNNPRENKVNSESINTDLTIVSELGNLCHHCSDSCLR